MARAVGAFEAVTKVSWKSGQVGQHVSHRTASVHGDAIVSRSREGPDAPWPMSWRATKAQGNQARKLSRDSRRPVSGGVESMRGKAVRRRRQQSDDEARVADGSAFIESRPCRDWKQDGDRPWRSTRDEGVRRALGGIKRGSFDLPKRALVQRRKSRDLGAQVTRTQILPRRRRRSEAEESLAPS